MKAEGSLCCSDYEVLEFRFFIGRNRSKKQYHNPWERVWESRLACSVLFNLFINDLDYGIKMHIVIWGEAVRELGTIQPEAKKAQGSFTEVYN